MLGKHFLVVGASRGLGFQVVEQLLDEGAYVSAVARNATVLREAESRWRTPANDVRLRTRPIDLSESESEGALADFLRDQGALHGLICVAGNGRPINRPPLMALRESESRNLAPAVTAIEACKPLFDQRDGAAVVLVSSIAALEFMECPVEYAAVKSMLHVYASHWARELSPVRVNVLAPGNMRTKDSIWWERERSDPALLDSFLQREVALGRLADPDEIARLAVFLASPASSFVTGSTVVADGGQSARW